MRHIRAVAALASVVLAAGCGGSSSKHAIDPTAGASIVPASAALYVWIDTDPGSDQWKKASALLDKFPAKNKLLGKLQSVLPALGPETDVAVLGKKQIVGLTQPKDAAKLNQALDQAGQKHVEISGWTVFADRQSTLDDFRSQAKQGVLTDDPGFKGAMGKLTADAVAKAYVNGAQLRPLAGLLGSSAKLKSAVAELVARDDGVKLDGSLTSTSSAGFQSYTPKLTAEAPAGALFFVDFHGSPELASRLQGLSGLPKQLGQLAPALAQLGPLLEGEGALYVRAGAPLPEITLALEEQNPQQAMATLDGLAQQLSLFLGKGGKVEPTTVGGVQAKKLTTPALPIPIFYGLVGSQLVVTDSPAGFSGLRSGGQKLKDDPLFQDTAKAAGLGSTTGGFLYVDLQDAVPLLESFAPIAGISIPKLVDQNLQPLKTFLLYGSASGNETTFTAFLSVR